MPRGAPCRPLHVIESRCSEVSVSIARTTGNTVRIMWFLDVLTGAGQETSTAAMPWIVVEVNEESDRDPGLTQSAVADANLHRLVHLHADRAICNRATLMKFEDTPTSMDVGGRHVLLQPDATIVRDKQFLADFSRILKSLPHQWKVLYAGSMLAHAPYQLQQLGVAVVALHQPVRPPRVTYLQKLVRDYIPKRIEATGEQASVTVLGDLDFGTALRQKLVEEAFEVAYSSDSDEMREELADLLAVARTLCEFGGVGEWSDVEATAAEKERKRGGFRERRFLRATGYSARAFASKPGSARVRRLSTQDGIRVPLIPPMAPQPKVETFKFHRLGVQATVKFQERFVRIRVVRLRKSATHDRPEQLSLFEFPDEDGDGS